MTLKMEIAHTEHSHVIGKGGNNIKRVMQDTGCHIHFPDSNRTAAAEKSNQVTEPLPSVVPNLFYLCGKVAHFDVFYSLNDILTL